MFKVLPFVTLTPQLGFAVRVQGLVLGLRSFPLPHSQDPPDMFYASRPAYEKAFELRAGGLRVERSRFLEFMV